MRACLAPTFARVSDFLGLTNIHFLMALQLLPNWSGLLQ